MVGELPVYTKLKGCIRQDMKQLLFFLTIPLLGAPAHTIIELEPGLQLLRKGINGIETGMDRSAVFEVLRHIAPSGRLSCEESTCSKGIIQFHSPPFEMSFVLDSGRVIMVRAFFALRPQTERQITEHQHKIITLLGEPAKGSADVWRVDDRTFLLSFNGVTCRTTAAHIPEWPKAEWMWTKMNLSQLPK